MKEPCSLSPGVAAGLVAKRVQEWRKGDTSAREPAILLLQQVGDDAKAGNPKSIRAMDLVQAITAQDQQKNAHKVPDDYFKKINTNLLCACCIFELKTYKKFTSHCTQKFPSPLSTTSPNLKNSSNFYFAYNFVYRLSEERPDEAGGGKLFNQGYFVEKKRGLDELIFFWINTDFRRISTDINFC